MNILKKTYKPCHNRVLIKFVRNSDSVIELPDGKNAGQRTIVQAVGPDVKCCAVGDEIIAILNPTDSVGVDEAEKLVLVSDNFIVCTVQG